jgi:hypothetical protein
MIYDKTNRLIYIEDTWILRNPNLIPRRVFATILLGPFDTVYMILVHE